jgi:hypothetical protein
VRYLSRQLPEEELAIEVGDVNGVHVDNVDVAKAGEGKVLQEFASQATGADD